MRIKIYIYKVNHVIYGNLILFFHYTFYVIFFSKYFNTLLCHLFNMRLLYFIFYTRNTIYSGI